MASGKKRKFQGIDKVIHYSDFSCFHEFGNALLKADQKVSLREFSEALRVSFSFLFQINMHLLIFIARQVWHRKMY